MWNWQDFTVYELQKNLQVEEKLFIYGPSLALMSRGRKELENDAN